MPALFTAFCYTSATNYLLPEPFLDEIRHFGAIVGAARKFSSPDYSGYAIDVKTADRQGLRLALSATIAEATPAEQLEISLVPATLRSSQPKLFVLDVDSTLIQQEVIELLASYAGRETEVRHVTEAAMRGELDFAQSLHARVAMLAGLPETVLDEVQAAIRFSPGAERLVSAAVANGHKVAAVSGGFTQILDPLAAQLGLHHAAANELEIVSGQLTGRVLGDVIDRAAKEKALRLWGETEGIPLAATIAIGDGANDLDMMAAAGLSLAYNAKPAVREAADAAIWRLDLALELAGIH
ncbi:phosphoserine phosphatase SerB [Renibacterium salmoninarum]|nr:phosphoserine phosphatase SerB [Renibacterium salmoninarum]